MKRRGVARRERAPKASLVYDAACGVCRGFKESVESLDWKGAFAFVPLDDPRSDVLLAPMPRHVREASFHLVYADGRIVSADEAVPHVVRLLPGGRVTQWALRVPGARWLVRTAYNWVRRNRGRWSRRGPDHQE